jgi:hypothetical protein
MFGDCECAAGECADLHAFSQLLDDQSRPICHSDVGFLECHVGSERWKLERVSCLEWERNPFSFCHQHVHRYVFWSGWSEIGCEDGDGQSTDHAELLIDFDQSFWRFLCQGDLDGYYRECTVRVHRHMVIQQHSRRVRVADSRNQLRALLPECRQRPSLR